VAWLAALLLLGAGACVRAHIPAGYDLRALHLVRAQDGLHAYFRLTLPLLVGAALGPRQPDGNYAPAPFTVLRIQSAHGFYYPDVARMQAEPMALGRLIADGHRIQADGVPLQAHVVSARAYPKGWVPPFNTVAQARQATAPGPGYPTGAPEVDAAYVVIDAHLFYPRVGGVTSVRIGSTLDNRILGQPEVQNLIVDGTGAEPIVYRATGLLADPITINPSAWQAVATFMHAGIAHIAGGADHLLFVLCLALGASSLGALAWRVTGFTLGHSVTLVAGFVGYVPQSAWFPAAVESAIAASIVLAAVAVLRTAERGRMLALTATVGLVHGLGFSFALREMLQLDGPHLALSLAAFNLGVEAGQIVSAALVWGLMAAFAVHAARWQSRLRLLLALGCIVVGALWMVERITPLIAPVA